MKGTIVGSYRRGAETSGDIDMLITMDVEKEVQTKAFHSYVKTLRERGYMIEELSKGDQKNLSIVRLTPELPARRLDLLIIPAEQIAYALLYFTGSQGFNVAFRQEALKQGYTLNEHEMKLTGKVEAKPVPQLSSEEEVFAFLGIKYKEPKDRTGATAVEKAAPAPAPEPKKKAKWVQKISKTTGNPYWYNRETKESTWDKPANFDGCRRATRKSKKNP
jgi:hypothetical protein